MPQPSKTGAAFLAAIAEMIGRKLASAGIERSKVVGIGNDVRRDIQQRYAGRAIYIPMIRNSATELAAKVRGWRDSGMSIGDIAARLGITTRYVYRLLKADAGPTSPAEPASRRTKHGSARQQAQKGKT